MKTPSRRTPGRAATGGASRTRTEKSSTARKLVSTPGKKTTSRRARPAKLDAKTLPSIREKLTNERAELQKQIVEIDEESFRGTQSDMTGEVGLDDDFADAGTATFDRERALSIQNNIRDLVDQMSRAVERIDEGKYGTCERCGKPIDAARLKALPHALLCMDCKRREERAR